MIEQRRRLAADGGVIRFEYLPDPVHEPARLARGGEMHLAGPVGRTEDFSVANVRRALDDLADVRRLIVNLDSDGGQSAEGDRIYLALKECGKPVTVRIRGQACSAASVVAMAAHRIEIAPTARIMIHCASGPAHGTARELRDLATYLEAADATALDIYHARVRRHLSRGRLAEMMEAETSFIGRDAIRHGFADALLIEPEAP